MTDLTLEACQLQPTAGSGSQWRLRSVQGQPRHLRPLPAQQYALTSRRSFWPQLPRVPPVHLLPQAVAVPAVAGRVLPAPPRAFLTRPMHQALRRRRRRRRRRRLRRPHLHRRWGPPPSLSIAMSKVARGGCQEAGEGVGWAQGHSGGRGLLHSDARGAPTVPVTTRSHSRSGAKWGWFVRSWCGSGALGEVSEWLGVLFGTHMHYFERR